MNVGDTVTLIGAALDVKHLIGRKGVVVPNPHGGSYLHVLVEGPHNDVRHGDKHTFLFRREELRPLSALEQLAAAGDE